MYVLYLRVKTLNEVPPVISNWILTNGIWTDLNIWIDTEVWED